MTRAIVQLEAVNHVDGFPPLLELVSRKVPNEDRPPLPGQIARTISDGRGGVVVVHVVPAAEFLRWLADMIELAGREV